MAICGTSGPAPPDDAVNASVHVDRGVAYFIDRGPVANVDLVNARRHTQRADCLSRLLGHITFRAIADCHRASCATKFDRHAGTNSTAASEHHHGARWKISHFHLPCTSSLRNYIAYSNLNIY
jgi:hypothetical protein